MTEILQGIYYYFDCMDGLIGDKPLTAADVSEILHGRAEDLTEKQLIHIAANYEATLYRQEYTAGELTAEAILYDCMRARITKITNTQAEPMQRNEILNQYQRIFDILNKKYFNNELLPIKIDYLTSDKIDNALACFVFDDETNEIEIILQLEEPPEYGVNTDTISDLYHELIHYYNYLQGIRDVSGKDLLYHNFAFRKAAEEHGAKCKYTDIKNGFNNVSLPKKELQEVFNNI